MLLFSRRPSCALAVPAQEALEMLLTSQQHAKKLRSYGMAWGYAYASDGRPMQRQIFGSYYS